MIIIDRQLTSKLTDEAKSTPRRRKNFNFHNDFSDPVNRMLNAFEPGTYVRPHKHESPDKCEVFIILSGKALAVRFDDAGDVLEHATLDSSRHVYGVEFFPRQWHTIVSLVSGTVLYEVKPGPYVPIDDKNFAPWAPTEDAPEAPAYLASLLDRLGIASGFPAFK
jgi:cupin fold WbuC family metalloprotein